MKYTTEIIVNVPLSQFVSKFNNPANLKHWQRNLISHEHISGVPGKYGAKMKFTFLMGKKKFDLIETIDHAEFPHEFSATYFTQGVDNKQKNKFYELNSNATKWVSENEFIPLNLSMRLYTIFFPKTFKRQTKQYMKDFKNFVEKGTSVLKNQ